MKKKLLHCWLFLVVSQVNGSIVSAQNWTFVKERQSVKIYTRTIEGSGLRACKGVAEILLSDQIISFNFRQVLS